MVSLLEFEPRREEVGALDKCCVLGMPRVGKPNRAWCDGRGEREKGASRGGERATEKTGSDAIGPSQEIRASGGLGSRSSLLAWHRSRLPRPSTRPPLGGESGGSRTGPADKACEVAR